MSRILYCEGLENPEGIDKASPELSWEIVEEWKEQRYFEIQVIHRGKNIYDSGKVWGKQLSHILPISLKPFEEYEWILQWGLDGEEGGRARAHFSTGMFSEEQWKAKKITGGTLLRKQFSVDCSIKKAVLFYTGLGYCEAYLNGKKITDRVLFPSYTVYDKTVEYIGVDVTDQLKIGKNVLGMMLAGHWPLDQNLKAKDVYSDAFYQGQCFGLMQLNVENEDGRRYALGTDSTWRVSDSPVISSSVFDGETYDGRLEKKGWNEVDYDDSSWKYAIESAEKIGKLQYSYIPPIRVLEDIQVKRIWKQGSVWMLDFGQNFTGWLSLSLRNQNPGDVIQIRHGELLYEDNSLNVENLRFAKACDQYICAGGSETYEPRFTYHGFRYAEISGIREKLTIDMVCARRVHTDNRENAIFECSAEEINRIYHCMLWTMRSNMHSIPTDCCQRDERQGWLADAGVSSEFGVLNFNLNNFYRKWLHDIRDTQKENGEMPLAGAPGWPRDTFIWKIGWHMTLRNLYLYTGNKTIIKENYPSLKKYENHLHLSLEDGVLPYDFYNDWLAIEFANNLMIANSFLADFYDAMILFADVLQDKEDKKVFGERKKELVESINRKFYGWCLDNPLGTGYYGTCDTMAVAPSAMALSFGIVPDRVKEKVIREMLFQLTESRGSIQYPTGILTSGILTQCLADLGYDDIVWQFLKRKDYPSFQFMLSKGATTIWERWQYLTHNEMNSHNHPALCGVGTWLFKSLCGLRRTIPLQDGGMILYLEPYTPEDLDYAKMKTRTPWGRIQLEWKRLDGKVNFYAVIPGGITAKLKLQNQVIELGGGEHKLVLT